jgi:hypothetical protein
MTTTTDDPHELMVRYLRTLPSPPQDLKEQMRLFYRYVEQNMKLFSRHQLEEIALMLSHAGIA